MNHAKKIVVIGTGNWGKNLVRTFSELGALEGLCDTNKSQVEDLSQKYNITRVFSQYQDVLRCQNVDAVVIASPAALHFEMAKAALLAGKDVFVEKPLALKVEQGEELIRISDEKRRILMVDHLLQYHPAFIKLNEMVDAGTLGKLQYIYSNRLNIGRLRTEENILWSFAPHDISIILSLTGKKPKDVRVFGEAYLQDGLYDTTITDLTFGDRLKAHIFVSWLHPFKEQKMVVIGSSGMAVFNDVEEEEKLTFFPHKIEWIKHAPVATKAKKEVVDFEKKEPLKEAGLHFIECIEKRITPKTDGREALEVLKILQQAQNYLDKEHSYGK